MIELFWGVVSAFAVGVYTERYFSKKKSKQAENDIINQYIRENKSLNSVLDEKILRLNEITSYNQDFRAGVQLCKKKNYPQFKYCDHFTIKHR